MLATTQRGVLCFLAFLAPLFGQVEGAPQVTNIITESVDYTDPIFNIKAISNTDIGDASQGATTAFTAASGTLGNCDACVIDGMFGSAGDTSAALLPGVGSVLEIFLNTSVNQSGYDITDFVNTTGWNSPTRTNHQYLLELRPVGGSYTSLIDVAVGGDNDPDNQPAEVAEEGTQITINDDGGGSLGTNIEAVRFTFHNDNEGTSPEAYQEFDINGTVSTPLPPATQFAWDLPGLGDWNSGDSWQPVGPGTQPNSNGHTALFGGDIQASSTVTVDQPITVNRIEFDNPDNTYAIAGFSSVNLQANPSGPIDPTIQVTSGSHKFQATVNLRDDTTVTVDSGDLSFDNQVDLMGNMLSLPGTAFLNHSVVDSVGGGMVSGSGTLGAEGDTTIGADLTLDGATLDIDLLDSRIGLTSDRLNVVGSATLQGDITVDVDLVGGYRPTRDISILTTTGGIIDNSSSLSVIGNGSVAFTGVHVIGNNLVLSVAVPEPAAIVLLLVGALLCCGTRRLSRPLEPNPNPPPRSAGEGVFWFCDRLSDISRRMIRMRIPMVLCVSALAFSASTVWGQILLPNGEPDPAFNGNAMQVWLRADSGVTTTGGAVSDWQDRSNNNNDATQSNADDQPTHAFGSFGGREVINFEGGATDTDHLDMGTGFDSTFDGDFTVFALYAPADGDPDRDDVFFGLVNDTPNDRIILNTNGNADPVTIDALYRANGVSDNLAAPSPFPDGPQTDFTLVTWVGRDAGPYELFFNGDATAAATAEADADNTLFDSGNLNAFLGAASFAGSDGFFPSGNRTFAGGIAEFIIYDGALSTDDREMLENYLLGIPNVPQATRYEWDRVGRGDWNSEDSWNPIGAPGTVPNSNQRTAIFGAFLQTSSTVAVDAPITVNRIEFNNAASTYVIAGTESVNLQTDPTGPTDPTIEVTAGSHTFQATVNFEDDTTVTVTSGDLSFDGPVDLMGSTLNLSGSVSLNHSVTGGGSISSSGTLGTEGDTTITADLTLDGATLDIDLRDSAGGVTSDQIDVVGSATLEGSIAVNVDLVGGFDPMSDIAILTTTGGIIDNSSSLAVTGPGMGEFSGVSVVGNNLVLQIAGAGVIGDFNGNGIWDLPDLNLVLFNWQQDKASLPVEWLNQRPDTVGLESLNLVLFNWQQASSLAVVPEPASLVMLLIGVLLCCGRRTNRI